MDGLLLQIDVFVRSLREIPQFSELRRVPGKSELQSCLTQHLQLYKQYNQAHLMGEYCCPGTQLYHIICHLTAKKGEKFHPPSHTHRSSRLHRRNPGLQQHLMVRYPWWSGYEKTQWRRDLREKSSHASSYAARYPTSTLWCCVYFRTIL